MHNSRNFWDTYASDFDAIYGTKNTIINSLINKFCRQAIKMRFEKTLQNIPDSKISVIDIGDIDQPRLKFPILKSIRHYINISETENKLIDITRKISFANFAELLSTKDLSRSCKW